MFKIKGKIIDSSSRLVMGILNLTPDSFFAGSRQAGATQLLQSAEKMILEGTDMLDLGAVSTRPGAVKVAEEAEFERLIPAVKLLAKHFPDVIFSVDTWRSNIAKAAVDEGADVVNDISAGVFDPKMLDFIASQDIPYIIMHIEGTPETMQIKPIENRVIDVVNTFLTQRISMLEALGASRIIADPGFGFGKSLQSNFELLQKLDTIRVKDYPLLVGLSRKSMIYKYFNSTPEDALNGTTALNMAALLKGANILRVHDVKEAKETVKLYNMLQQD
ncbi:MAG TPA: dihydropteroate synthase [Bacteroidales bacterium]|nr:dihydropteroate synthase [Bacteroidales bacterium]